MENYDEDRYDEDDELGASEPPPAIVLPPHTPAVSLVASTMAQHNVFAQHHPQQQQPLSPSPQQQQQQQQQPLPSLVKVPLTPLATIPSLALHSQPPPPSMSMTMPSPGGPTAAAAASASATVPMTPSQPTLGLSMIVQNVVSTVSLQVRLDLKKIALGARNAEYNPKRFAAVIMRIRDPKTTALIFASGKLVVTGAKTEDASKQAAKKYARIIQKLGFEARFTDFKVQNMVASCDVRFPIRLEGLSFAQPQFCSYEPELFPGLIYRMIEPKVVLLIFVSGKIVLTGAKNREDIKAAIQNIVPVLRGFQKVLNT